MTSMTSGGQRPLPTPRPLPGFDDIALFLDLDGTLADFEARPEDVRPEPWRTSLLRQLQGRLDGRLAVISGRSLEEVDRILEGSVTAVGAVHGLVRRTGDGMVEGVPADPALAEARVQLERFVAAHPGLMLEDKQVSLAIHSRQAPELSAAARGEAERICAGTTLKLQPGELVTEVRTAGADKGAAVHAFMQEHPFKGSLPVFVGDDLTDEDGFRVARALGGVSVLVGPIRPTGADLRLEDVEAVRAWLEAGLMQSAET